MPPAPDRRTARLAVFGGQVRVPLWMRVKAALSPVPVEVMRADDAVCAGAALVAGQAGGSLDDVPVLPSGRMPAGSACRRPWARRSAPRREPCGGRRTGARWRGRSCRTCATARSRRCARVIRPVMTPSCSKGSGSRRGRWTWWWRRRRWPGSR
ncbi:FGGY-family carbohydrate kinase [Nonomuraea sp. NPDC050643]|uniref:FGGY-family carbohydrate kinase n=1 Tax=Nonomuraea sp. NPDC050643 TaxID=3155660 RepID=UPI0033C9203C